MYYFFLQIKNTSVQFSHLVVSNSLQPHEVERFYEDLQDLLEHPKMMSFSLKGTGMQK